MPKQVPQKNVEPVLVDVKRPGFNYRHIASHGGRGLNLSRVPQSPKIDSPILNRTAVGLGILAAVLAITFVTVNFVQAKDLARTAGQTIIANFSNSVAALRDLNPEAANRYLKDNNSQIGVLDVFFKDRHGDTLLGALGTIIPAFKGTGTLVSGISSLNFNFLRLSTALTDLKANGFHYFQTDGQRLISQLNETRDALGAVATETKNIKNATGELKTISTTFEEADRELGGEYLAHADDLDQAAGVINELIATLGSDTPKNILLMFQNPAEIRPAGGFLGSYGVLSVRGGQMQSLEVGDIYNPDRLLKAKIVPPRPLQRVTTDLGARDANWFFDFPTSARTVAGILEESELYAKEGTKFDAVVAVNINVLETILEAVGSIELPEYKLTIDKDNFLPELQREIEAGKDKKPGQNPKRILSVLAPQIFERLGNLNEASRTALMEKIGDHFTEKDIMVYAKTPQLASFLKAGGIDGSVYETPSNFLGSYLAVVNANVAGGKSDAFVSEAVKAVVDLDADGGSVSTVTVTRKHTGENEKDAWWRATNQNFIRFFTTPGSALISLKGNSSGSMGSSAAYGSSYERIPELQAVEETQISLSGYNAWATQESGKSVFGTWFSVPAGQSKELIVRYQTPKVGNPVVEPGAVYTFVFERQSGVDNSLEVSIGAPLGYRWKETGASVYTETREHVEARTSIALTLEK